GCRASNRARSPQVGLSHRLRPERAIMMQVRRRGRGQTARSSSAAPVRRGSLRGGPSLSSRPMTEGQGPRWLPYVLAILAIASAAVAVWSLRERADGGLPAPAPAVAAPPASVADERAETPTAAEPPSSRREPAPVGEPVRQRVVDP